MPIFDFFELPEMGVIVSGSNAELNDMSTEEIKSLFSHDIVIQRSDGKKVQAHIDAIDVSRSLIDQVNVSLCLGKSVRAADLGIGSKIFSLTSKDITDPYQKTSQTSISK